MSNDRTTPKKQKQTKQQQKMKQETKSVLNQNPVACKVKEIKLIVYDTT